MEPIQVLALVVILGVGAQWLAWRLKVPSILLLLGCGILAGPVWAMASGGETGLLNTRALLGELLGPVVSLSVALILYEGGLTLRFREIATSRSAVARLISLGALVTWVLSGLGAWIILDLPFELAALTGAVLVVTGPTVIGPLLRHVRPRGKVGPILKWEGIVIDPIGATLAVFVFEVVSIGMVEGDFQHALARIAYGLAVTVVVGGGLGFAGAWTLVVLLKRYLIPGYLQNPISMLLVFSVYVLANLFQDEAGLVAVTVMGIVLANQRVVEVRHIVEFKENLRVLLISTLFIILGESMSRADLRAVGVREFAFVGLLILVVRPASVFVAMIGEKLTIKEKVLLSWIAPRGIVAAAVASLFALKLQSLEGFQNAEEASRLVPTVFGAILGTVAIYGLTASLVARALGLADSNPQGMLIVGAHRWARELALALTKRKVPVLIADTNRENILAARLAGLRTYSGNVLGEHALEDLDLTGIGRVLAVTPNDEVNTLTAQRFGNTFERSEVYQLAPSPRRAGESRSLSSTHGRMLFANDANYARLASRFAEGHVVKATTLSDSFGYDDYRTLYGPRVLPLFIVSSTGRVTVVTAKQSISPEPGQTIIALVDPDDLLMGGPAAPGSQG